MSDEVRSKAQNLARAYEAQGMRPPWYVQHAEQTGHSTSWHITEGQRCLECNEPSPEQRLIEPSTQTKSSPSSGGSSEGQQ